MCTTAVLFVCAHLVLDEWATTGYSRLRLLILVDTYNYIVSLLSREAEGPARRSLGNPAAMR